MGLDVSDTVRIDPCVGQSLDHDIGLAVNAGSCVTSLLRAVVVDGRAFDDGINGVTTRGCISQPLQDNDSASAAENGTVGLRVKGTHLPVWRHHPATVVKVTGFVWDAHRNSAGQSHVRLFAQEALACEMDGYQRGRAGSLDRDAGALQIEFVGYPRAEKILVVYNQGGD